MAKVTSPVIDWAQPTIKPQAAGELLLPADLMEAGPPAILSRPVLVAPTFDQLINDPGVGYPF